MRRIVRAQTISQYFTVLTSNSRNLTFRSSVILRIFFSSASRCPHFLPRRDYTDPTLMTCLVLPCKIVYIGPTTPRYPTYPSSQKLHNSASVLVFSRQLPMLSQIAKICLPVTSMHFFLTVIQKSTSRPMLCSHNLSALSLSRSLASK